MSENRDPGCDHHSIDADRTAAVSAKAYYCPMCPGVESDKPGDCPKCGMRLERNPSFHATTSSRIYTCPMHPQIEQDHPGNCPICGMTLEPKGPITGGAEEDNAERGNMSPRFWISAALALPVFALAMAHLIPNAPAWLMRDSSRWIQFVLSTPVVLWGGWPF